MAVEEKVNLAKDKINQSIQVYAEVLEGIYQDRTAGDHTFTGVLTTYTNELLNILNTVRDEKPVKVRKRTRFDMCEVHREELRWKTARERAQIACEGGPALVDKPCTPDAPCRVWPGTDFFHPENCTGEAGWVQDWRCNRRARGVKNS